MHVIYAICKIESYKFHKWDANKVLSDAEEKQSCSFFHWLGSVTKNFMEQGVFKMD